MTRKNCLGKIVANTITVVTAIALNVFPRRSFLDRVRTAAVRTRYLIWSSMFTEIFQTVLFVRQKDFVDTFSADHLETSYELHPQKRYSSLQMSVSLFTSRGRDIPCS
jgi:hypothetical protein